MVCDLCKMAVPEKSITDFKIDISDAAGRYSEWEGDLKKYEIYVCINCLSQALNKLKIQESTDEI